jgi:hypothetical protein
MVWYFLGKRCLDGLRHVRRVITIDALEAVLTTDPVKPADIGSVFIDGTQP